MIKRIKFSKAEKDDMIGRIRTYFEMELDQQIGDVGAELLLEFFATDIGAYYYNRGLYDAQALIRDKVIEITDAIFELERPEAGTS